MTVAIIVAVFAICDCTIVWVLVTSSLAPLKVLAAEFPAREPAADAVGRAFQSFKFGIVNWGWGTHITVDSGYLHMRPARVSRWLGMPSLSIPWERVRVVKRGKRSTSVMLEGVREKAELTGPTWCLGMGGDGERRVGNG